MENDHTAKLREAQSVAGAAQAATQSYVSAADVFRTTILSLADSADGSVQDVGEEVGAIQHFGGESMVHVAAAFRAAAVQGTATAAVFRAAPVEDVFRAAASGVAVDAFRAVATTIESAGESCHSIGSVADLADNIGYFGELNASYHSNPVLLGADATKVDDFQNNAKAFRAACKVFFFAAHALRDIAHAGKSLRVGIDKNAVTDDFVAIEDATEDFAGGLQYAAAYRLQDVSDAAVKAADAFQSIA